MNDILRHPFDPLFSEDSETLILGSFPSVRSRREAFYYAHPANRFWKVIAGIYDREVPVTIEEKKELILGERLALWDPVASCRVTASYDATIRDVEPNDFSAVLDHSRVRDIYCNGRKSHQLYTEYIRPRTGVEAVYLPSTSSANAAWSLPELIRAWSVINERQEERKCQLQEE